DVEHPDALRDVCNFARNLRSKLPNFVCNQTTCRYIHKGNTRFSKKPTDVVTAHVIFEDAREHYTDIKLNGKPQAMKMDELDGQHTEGEYGSDLIFAFSPAGQPSYKFLREETVASRLAFVYQVRVSGETNDGWTLNANGIQTNPEFLAEISVDQHSHQLLRFFLTPKPYSGFPLQDVSLLTEYERLSLGDGTEFVLPIRSQASSCLRPSFFQKEVLCHRNVLEFKDCHKFRAKSRVLTDQESNYPD